jgi:Zn-finger nucleic acid-binding protein
MKCPKDGATLQMMERQGVEIDYCPECRGVWLDRGELDKIIERMASVAPPGPQPPAPQSYGQPPQPSYAPPIPQHPLPPPPQTYRYDDDDDDDYRRKRRKRGLLGELFDFD